ncbi:hypothetical protein MKJ01_14355 [Chryseobacterium sp. SSA4.19]|uniref:hypothetical protein n=1 Tax=Chryseobacterium sp. SSA4.19 TaxID=2919915 RepID=UPI001F4D7C65|nr:hypothetical protein [Chryseobacterium sp. SSA4.19]MCJ8154947.1 hypothetical protein [Chryseobacterium sp. SSA4.19]
MLKKLLFLSVISISGISFSQNRVKEKLGNYLDSLFVHHKVMGSFAFTDKNDTNFLKTVGFSDAENSRRPI